MQTQGVGGLCVIIMGKHIVDQEFLIWSGVSKELWMILNFASNLLHLKLASKYTVLKLSFYRMNQESPFRLCALHYI